jgi:hypothetical protein
VLVGYYVAKRIISGYADQGIGSALEESCIVEGITSGYIDRGSISAFEVLYMTKRLMDV